MSVTGLPTQGHYATVQPENAIPDLARRLIGAVSGELQQVAAGAGDRETAAKLEHARAILDWVLETAQSNTAVVADLESRVRSLSAVETHDESAGLAEAVYELLRARGVLVDDAAPDESEDVLAVPTPDQVTEYLRMRDGGAADVAHAVRAVHGGFSKRTLLVSATISGELCEIVIRQVPLGRSGRSLAPEFAVVKAAYDNGLPAPEPLWIESDDNDLGGPFFVTRRAAGDNFGDVWGPAGATREVCVEVAELYARLHGLDVGDLQAPISPRTTPDELREMLVWQENTLAKRGIVMEPVLASLFAWLRANLPPAATHRALIHGDAAFSNLLIDDGHVSAILDWEAAHLGDPAEELAYLRPSIEPVMEWSDFIDAYIRAGGSAPDPSTLRFYEVWQHVWRHIGCLWLAQNFDQSGRYASAVAAYVHGPRFLNAAVSAAFSGDESSR